MNLEPLNPSDPDAPLVALIQLSQGKVAAEMSDAELALRLQEIKALTAQHVTFTTKARKESNKLTEKLGGSLSKRAKLQSILDSI